jgi:lysophospholipase L1-like esterase
MKKIISLVFFIWSFLSLAAQHEKQGPSVAFLSKEVNRVAVHQNYYYHFAATGSAGKALVYSINGLPAWLHYHAADHSISGKPHKAGQYPVRLSVTNGDTTAYQYFMLTVYDRNTVNILCLGNSITNGTGKYNSYRRELWKILHAGNFNFDMIGSWSKHHMGGEMPEPDFDLDHEGHSGWTLEDMFHAPGWDSKRGNIYTWLQTYSPDMVLIELGTNDVFHCRTVNDMIADLRSLADLLRQKNRHVKIVAAQIPPLGKKWAQKKLCGNDTTYDQLIQKFNKAVAAFAKEYSTNASVIMAVDQYTGIDPATEMYDDIHPNEKGEKIMAERWFTAINKYVKKLRR